MKKKKTDAVAATYGIWADIPRKGADAEGTPDTYILYFYLDHADEVKALYELLDNVEPFTPAPAYDRADGSWVDIVGTNRTDAHTLVHNAKRSGILLSYEVY